jgi:hypothetical protein
MSAEAEESPLLEAVTRKRLMENVTNSEGLPCAVVICKAWRLAMALQLSTVTSRVLKLSTNPISNPNPVYSHPYTCQYVDPSLKECFGIRASYLAKMRFINHENPLYNTLSKPLHRQTFPI